MKKITKKQARELKCYAVANCSLPYLLKFKEPLFYTVGTYGWNEAIYSIDGFYISTGYRPTGVPINYKIALRYNTLAFTIFNKYSSYYNLNINKMKQEINEALMDFIKEIKEEGKNEKK